MQSPKAAVASETLYYVSFRHESKLRNLIPSASLHFEFMLSLRETYFLFPLLVLFLFIEKVD